MRKITGRIAFLAASIVAAVTGGALVNVGFAIAPWGLQIEGYDKRLVADKNGFGDVVDILWPRNLIFLAGVTGLTALLIARSAQKGAADRKVAGGALIVVAVLVIAFVGRYAVGVGDLAEAQDHAGLGETAAALVHGPLEFGAFLLVPTGLAVHRLAFATRLRPWSPVWLGLPALALLLVAALMEAYVTPAQVDDLCAWSSPACKSGEFK